MTTTKPQIDTNSPAFQNAVAALDAFLVEARIAKIATETGTDRRTVRRMAKAMGYTS